MTGGGGRKVKNAEDSDRMNSFKTSSTWILYFGIFFNPLAQLGGYISN